MSETYDANDNECVRRGLDGRGGCPVLNPGNYIGFAAPGVDMWTASGSGRYVSGTSYATPFVTAAVVAAQSSTRKKKSGQWMGLNPDETYLYSLNNINLTHCRMPRKARGHALFQKSSGC